METISQQPVKTMPRQPAEDKSLYPKNNDKDKQRTILNSTPPMLAQETIVPGLTKALPLRKGVVTQVPEQPATRFAGLRVSRVDVTLASDCSLFGGRSAPTVEKEGGNSHSNNAETADRDRIAGSSLPAGGHERPAGSPAMCTRALDPLAAGQSFADSGSAYWTIRAYWANEEEKAQNTMTINFAESVCAWILGSETHRNFIGGMRRHRSLVRFSVLTYNAAITSITVALLVNETLGTYLAIFAAVGAIQGDLQTALGMNRKLLKKLAHNPQFWTMLLLMLILWITVGIMLGGIRGPLVSLAGALVGIMGGPSKDSNHYRFRPSTGFFWTYLAGIALFTTLAGSMAFKVFRGGRVLRWSVGARQLTGEDIVVNSAATVVMFLLPFFVDACRSVWRRLRSQPQGLTDSSMTVPSGGVREQQKTMRSIRCVNLQWPLILEPMAMVDPSAVAAEERTTGGAGKQPSTQTIPPESQYALAPPMKPPTCDDVALAMGEGKTKGLSVDIMVPCEIRMPTTGITPPTLLHQRPSLLDQLVAKPILRSIRGSLARNLGHRNQGSSRVCRKKQARDCGCHNRLAMATVRVTPDGLAQEMQRMEVSGGYRQNAAGLTLVRHKQRWAQTGHTLGIRLLLWVGVGLIILTFYLGNQRKTCPTSVVLGRVLPILASITCIWNIISFLFLSSHFNASLLLLICKSSFDFWFLVAQDFALFLSLSDAFEYDARSLALIGWCLLYLGCLFADSILPPLNDKETKPRIITKQFMGGTILLPLLAIQCWFLYDLICLDGSVHLRARTMMQITKVVEEGVTDATGGAASVLNFSTDSFIVGRQLSIIVFSFPLFYHFLVQCAIPITSEGAPASKGCSSGERRLYFLTASVSYRVPICRPKANWQKG